MNLEEEKAKICNQCGQQKIIKEFRIRVDKRVKKQYLVYYNNICLKFEAANQRERTIKIRATEQGRLKHSKWAMEYHKRNREKCLNRMKQRRESQEYKDYIRQYRLKNKEKIYAQEIITKKNYHEKNRDLLTDTYIINQLTSQKVATKEMLLNPAFYSLIQAKRLQLLIKRKINQNDNTN